MAGYLAFACLFTVGMVAAFPYFSPWQEMTSEDAYCVSAYVNYISHENPEAPQICRFDKGQKQVIGTVANFRFTFWDCKNRYMCGKVINYDYNDLTHRQASYLYPLIHQKYEDPAEVDRECFSN